MEHFQLLLKPVSGKCNLRCSYCFYRAVPSQFPDKNLATMRDEALKTTVQQYLRLGFPENVFIWQGGEPTLAGLEFFERVVMYQQQFGRGQVVGNVIQTNGTLLDERWVEFFAKYKFLVGLSIDGPREIHDAARGDGTHATAMKAAALLAKNKVEFNILSVLHEGNVGKIREMYAFLRQLPTPFLQFIPALDNDPTSSTPMPHSVTFQQYGQALCALFDAWKDVDSARVSIRDFDSVLNSYLGLPGATCTYKDACAPYLVIENQGDVYPCDFFVRPQHCLGNVMADSFADLLPHRKTAFEGLKSRRDDACEKCPWRALCFGGCPKDRTYWANRHPDRSYLCPAYKQFFQNSFHWFARQSMAVARQHHLHAKFVEDLNPRLPCLCGSGRRLQECLLGSSRK